MRALTNAPVFFFFFFFFACVQGHAWRTTAKYIDTAFVKVVQSLVNVSDSL